MLFFPKKLSVGLKLCSNSTSVFGHSCLQTLALSKKTQNQSQGSDKKPNPFDKPKVDSIGPLVNIGAMDAVGVEKWATETLKETEGKIPPLIFGRWRARYSNPSN